MTNNEERWNKDGYSGDYFAKGCIWSIPLAVAFWGGFVTAVVVCCKRILG